LGVKSGLGVRCVRCSITTRVYPLMEEIIPIEKKKIIDGKALDSHM